MEAALKTQIAFIKQNIVHARRFKEKGKVIRSKVRIQSTNRIKHAKRLCAAGIKRPSLYQTKLLYIRNC